VAFNLDPQLKIKSIFEYNGDNPPAGYYTDRCHGCFLGAFNSTKQLVEPKNVLESVLKQFKSGIAANDVKCDNGLSLVIKSEDGSPACVKSQTAQKLVERGWGGYVSPNAKGTVSLPNSMHVEGTNFSVDYNITNAKVLGIKADIQSKSLIVSIKTAGDGKLTIDLPRTLIDAKCTERCILPYGTDVPFAVANDGQDWRYTEIKTATDRILTITFNAGTKQIEIGVIQII